MKNIDIFVAVVTYQIRYRLWFLPLCRLCFKTTRSSPVHDSLARQWPKWHVVESGNSFAGCSGLDSCMLHSRMSLGVHELFYELYFWSLSLLMIAELSGTPILVLQPANLASGYCCTTHFLFEPKAEFRIIKTCKKKSRHYWEKENNLLHLNCCGKKYNLHF